MTLDQFAADVEADLGQQVVGFDFSILVPILIQVLMDMLGDCGGVQRAKDLARKPKNWATRYAMRKALNQSLSESGQSLSSAADRQTIQTGVLQRLSTYSDDQIDALLSQADDCINYNLI